MERTFLLLLALAFGALTAAAVLQHGYWGIFMHQFQNLAGMQVLADLSVALTLIMVWMWRDAAANGRNVWPWLVATLALGSFGPLGYLLTASSRKA